MSNIDPTQPPYGYATTQALRDNFAHAKEEIQDLQDNVVRRPALAAYLPINGTRAMTGALELSGPPEHDMHATTKEYVDDTALRARDDALEIAAGLYLPLSGGEVSGPVGLLGVTNDPTHASTRAYVEQHVARTGDVMTGPLTLTVDPTEDQHAASALWVYRQVDTRIARAGDTMTGPLTLSGDPTAYLHAATQGWVNRQIGSVAGITEAPDDGRIHGRSPGRWDPVVPIYGGALNGPFTLYRHPEDEESLEASTVGFVLRAAVPIGALADHASEVIPERWLLCAGQAISRTHYAELFAAIGAQWGAGDGVDTFNVPDYRGRISIGHDAHATGRVTVINAAAVGAVGGDQLLHAHAHAVYDPGHDHGGADSGHIHGLADPTHAHPDGTHGHGPYDPGHSHYGQHHPGTFDPGGGAVHTRSWIGHTNDVRTDGVGTGLQTHAHPAWIGVSGTGAWHDWGHAAVVVYHGGTGIVGLDGAGAGDSQNMPPAAVAAKMIFAGVLPPPPPIEPEP